MVNRRDRVRFMVRFRGYMSVNSPELFFWLGLGLAMLSAVSTSSENSVELTDKYRAGIAISDGIYAVWCKMSRKPLYPSSGHCKHIILT